MAYPAAAAGAERVRAVSETEQSPKLLDCAAIMAELGVKRSSAESLMQAIPKVKVGRRVFVRREDLEAELERRAAA
jgi:hypothetical protein